VHEEVFQVIFRLDASFRLCVSNRFVTDENSRGISVMCSEQKYVYCCERQSVTAVDHMVCHVVVVK
jgi:hypothetical protein